MSKELYVSKCQVVVVSVMILCKEERSLSFKDPAMDGWEATCLELRVQN
jgi:hypothetical protein